MANSAALVTTLPRLGGLALTNCVDQNTTNKGTMSGMMVENSLFIT